MPMKRVNIATMNIKKNKINIIFSRQCFQVSEAGQPVKENNTTKAGINAMHDIH